MSKSFWSVLFKLPPALCSVSFDSCCAKTPSPAVRCLPKSGIDFAIILQDLKICIRVVEDMVVVNWKFFNPPKEASEIEAKLGKGDLTDASGTDLTGTDQLDAGIYNFDSKSQPGTVYHPCLLHQLYFLPLNQFRSH